MIRLPTDIEENDQEIQEVSGNEKQVSLDIETIAKEMQASRIKSKGDDKKYWVER